MDKDFFDTTKDSGGFYKIKIGDNKMRVLAKPFAHVSEYNNNVSEKFMTWVFVDNQLKLYDMARSVARQIHELMTSEDWGFEKFPMTYDINVKAQGEGMERKYTVQPSPKKTEIPAEILKQLEDENTPAEVVANIENKKVKKSKEEIVKDMYDDIEEESDVSKIPF